MGLLKEGSIAMETYCLLIAKVLPVFRLTCLLKCSLRVTAFYIDKLHSASLMCLVFLRIFQFFTQFHRIWRHYFYYKILYKQPFVCDDSIQNSYHNRNYTFVMAIFCSEAFLRLIDCSYCLILLCCKTKLNFCRY